MPLSLKKPESEYLKAVTAHHKMLTTQIRGILLRILLPESLCLRVKALT
jgi:hypothetical protein